MAEQELDEGTAADEEAADGSEQALLLALADGLEALPRPELDPEVKTVQRAQLIAAMETAFAGGAEGAQDADSAQFPGQRGLRGRTRVRAPARGAHRAPSLGPLSKLRPKSRLGKGLAAGGLGVGVAASAFGGMAAASTDALPGDTLYGLKRGMEDLRLDLAGGDADKGSVHLDHASTRLQEARRLLERDRSGGGLDHESLGEVRKALSGMQHDASEGHRLLTSAYERDGDIGRIQSLSTFTKNHRAAWTQLRHRLPPQLADVGDGVSSVLDAMDDEVSPLKALLPEAPDEKERPEREPRGTGERTDGQGPSPEPSAPAQPRDTQRQPGGSGGGEAPTPSPSQGGSEERPSEDERRSPSQQEGEEDRQQSPSESGSGDTSPPDTSEPRITLPPVVPEVLPRLDLGGGES
nr:DUF5667 domain-containing protein [Streptomyces boncukensis]